MLTWDEVPVGSYYRFNEPMFEVRKKLSSNDAILYRQEFSVLRQYGPDLEVNPRTCLDVPRRVLVEILEIPECYEAERLYKSTTEI